MKRRQLVRYVCVLVCGIVLGVVFAATGVSESSTVTLCVFDLALCRTEELRIWGVATGAPMSYVQDTALSLYLRKSASVTSVSSENERKDWRGAPHPYLQAWETRPLMVLLYGDRDLGLKWVKWSEDKKELSDAFWHEVTGCLDRRDFEAATTLVARTCDEANAFRMESILAK